MAGVLFIVFGIYLWSNPAETLLSYSLYLGLMYIVSSIGVLSYFLLKKIRPVPYGNILISFIIGFTILSLPMLSLSLILWIFIFGFLAAAIFCLTRLQNKNQKQKGKYHVVQLTVSVVAVIYGVIMLINPIVGANTLTKIIAAFVIFNGVSYIFPGQIEPTKARKELKKGKDSADR